MRNIPIIFLMVNGLMGGVLGIDPKEIAKRQEEMTNAINNLRDVLNLILDEVKDINRKMKK